MAAIRLLVIVFVVLVVLPGLTFGALFLDFRARADPFSGNAVLPKTAVVFGGSHDRLYLAMDLLERGLVEDVFISGANRSGGIRSESFADDYDVPLGARMKLEAGRVVFAPLATNTLENAVETSCWLRGHPEVASVTLITSRSHMPRASVALERSLPRNVRIVRFPSEPQTVKYDVRDRWQEEFYKYVATWFGTLIKIGAWGEAQGLCAAE